MLSAFPSRAADERGQAAKRLGMILPGAAQGVAEAVGMFPEGVHFEAEVLGLQSMSRTGFDAIADRILPAADALAARAADAIMLMGTSLSFYNGAEFNAKLRERIAAATGLPALTMSDAIIDGLRRLGARRLAVTTAYGDEVNGQLLRYLAEEDFAVDAIRGLGITALGGTALTGLTGEDILAFAAGTCAIAADADAALVSCGALQTFALLQPLEDCSGMPCVSSFPHAVQAGIRLLGLDARIPGHGLLLANG